MSVLKISKTSKQELNLNDSLPEELERLISLHGVDWSGRLINRCGLNFNPVPVY